MTSNQLIDLLTKALTILLVPAVTLLATMLSNYLRQQTKSMKVKALLQQATDIVCNVVAEVNQTFVDQLKKEGAFDKRSAQMAAKKALDLAKAQLGSEGLKLLDEVMADGSAYLKSLIEHEVRIQKGAQVMKKWFAVLFSAFLFLAPTVGAVSLPKKTLPAPRPLVLEVEKDSDDYRRFAVILPSSFRLYFVKSEKATTVALPIKEEDVLAVYTYSEGLTPADYVEVDGTLLVDALPGYLVVSLKERAPKVPDVLVTEKPKPTAPQLKKDVVPQTGAAR